MNTAISISPRFQLATCLHTYVCKLALTASEEFANAHTQIKKNLDLGIARGRGKRKLQLTVPQLVQHMDAVVMRRSAHRRLTVLVPLKRMVGAGLQQKSNFEFKGALMLRLENFLRANAFRVGPEYDAALKLIMAHPEFFRTPPVIKNNSNAPTEERLLVRATLLEKVAASGANLDDKERACLNEALARWVHR